MKIWTFLEAKTKLEKDLSLQDELFIDYDELSGKFNDALTDAVSEIHTLNKDYLLALGYVPLLVGVEKYALPYNIYANKIRQIMYTNGSIIYQVKQYRPLYKFEDQMYTEQYGSADPYKYTVMNDIPGQAVLQVRPMSRESAILPPQAGAFTPMYMWYQRNCVRIPMTGEYCNPEALAPTQFNTGTNVITVNAGTANYGIIPQGQMGCFPGSIAYITGDQVQFQPGPTGTLPSGITAGVTYFVISVTPTTIKIATTLANAVAGTAVSLGSTGTVFSIMTVAATAKIIEATLLDIPEFTPFILQHVAVTVMNKDTDGRYAEAVAERDRLRKLMVDSLTQSIPDNDDTIQEDFSAYMEMS